MISKLLAQQHRRNVVKWVTDDMDKLDGDIYFLQYFSKNLPVFSGTLKQCRGFAALFVTNNLNIWITYLSISFRQTHSKKTRKRGKIC
jgi:translation initiation factor RLI1